MVNHRSKSGCWTCRLRRKKCPEDGMPCSNCKARAVVCHGYGPRPAWKDRGEREQEEVDRLQLRRRSQTTRWRGLPAAPPQQRPELGPPSAEQQQQQQQQREEDSAQVQQPDNTTDHVCLSPSLALVSPVEMTLQPPSPPQSTAEQEDDDDGEPYDFSALLDPQLSLSNLPTPSVMSGLWADGIESVFISTTPPPLFDSAATTLNSQVESAHGDAGQEGGYATLQAFTLASIHHVNALQEREIELMMQFLGADFGKLHPCAQSLPMADKAWLMWMLHRSPTFFYTALSTSAYFAFLKTPPHDGRRTEYFREYDQFRNRAMELYCQLLDVRGHSSVRWNTTETLICSVQLAMLDSLGENLNATLTYLDAASDALAKFSEDPVYIGELSPDKSTSLPPVSGMERRTVEFFICILIRIHTLHCSSYQAVPAAASLYRRILSPAMLGDNFFQVAGFHPWVLLTLMDAVGAAAWKQEQEAKQRLSMRGLVAKSEVILSKIEDQIQRENNVQTLIYAYAVIIYIHTLTSGCRPAVPEIHEALDKAVPLWQKCSFQNQELRSVAWAFCVSASLATGDHRSAFTSVLSEAAASDSSSTTVACLRALSEECWKVSDTGGAADCNWRVIMQSLKPGMQTMFV